MKFFDIWLLAATCFFFAAIASGGVYYVDGDHTGADDRNAGRIDKPWKTLTPANRVASAGDTVFIRQGLYRSFIAPENSGNASAPIVFTRYADENVTIANAEAGIYLDGVSFIVVSGIHFSNLDRFLWIENNAHHNTIAYCCFDQGRHVGWSGSRIHRNSTHNRVHHCRFSDYGYYHYNDIGSVMDIGDEESRTDTTGYNLIEDNVFFHGGHHVLGIASAFNVIRRNYFHNEPWSMGTWNSDRGAILYGNRNVYFSGYPENSGRNLFENNRVAYSADPPDNIGAPGMALSTSHNIVRFNEYYYNDRAGLAMTVTSSYYSDIVDNRIYHNTFFCNGLNDQDPNDHMNSGIGFGLYSGSLIISGNAMKNNIFFRHRAPIDAYRVDLEMQVIESNWMGERDGDPLFVDAQAVPADPMNAAYPDLRLQPESPCRNAGSFLTRITSPGGAGSSFQVDDAGYFTDGWGITEGDRIRLIGSEHEALILNVDYESNVLTVDTTITWSQNQGVCLLYEGEAPDIGAWEGKESKPLPPQNLRFLGTPGE